MKIIRIAQPDGAPTLVGWKSYKGNLDFRFEITFIKTSVKISAFLNILEFILKNKTPAKASAPFAEGTEKGWFINKF